MAKMMKVFSTEAAARNYIAQQGGGRITVQYNWDEMRRMIIRVYIVKF